MGKGGSKHRRSAKKTHQDSARTPSGSTNSEHGSSKPTSTAGTELKVSSATRISDFSSSGGFPDSYTDPSKTSKKSKGSKQSKASKKSDKSSKRKKNSENSETSKHSEQPHQSEASNHSDSAGNNTSEHSHQGSSNGQHHDHPAPSDHHSHNPTNDTSAPAEVHDSPQGEIETLIPAPVSSGFPTVAEAEEPINADILELIRSQSGNFKPRVRESSASTSLVIRKPPSNTSKSDSFWQRFFGWGTQDCCCDCPITCDQYDVVLQTPATLGCASTCAPVYNYCDPCQCQMNFPALCLTPKREDAATTAEHEVIPEPPTNAAASKPVEQSNQTDPIIPSSNPKSQDSRKSSKEQSLVKKHGTFPRCDRFSTICREPACNRPRPSWQQAPPPVFISSTGGGGSDTRRGLVGLEKLKNVDIVEELTYCTPCGCGCGGCCSCDPCCCSNACCPQCVTCGCCGLGESCCCCVDGCRPMGPIKYCRRQRFNFNERRYNSQEATRQRVSEAKPNPYDEIPVGKNPTPSDVLRQSVSVETGTGTGTTGSGIPIEDVLPSESGTYYFNAERSTFAPVEEVGITKKPPYAVEEIIEQEPVLTKIEPVVTKDYRGASYGPPADKAS